MRPWGVEGTLGVIVCRLFVLVPKEDVERDMAEPGREEASEDAGRDVPFCDTDRERPPGVLVAVGPRTKFIQICQ